MPNSVIEKIPAAAVLFDDFDFTDELPGDTSVTGAVTAVDSGGVAAPSVVGAVTTSGMFVKAVVQAGTNGQDYLLDFKATGVTTAQIAVKQLEVRVRSKVTGAL
jgi:hypothetical protein